MKNSTALIVAVAVAVAIATVLVVPQVVISQLTVPESSPVGSSYPTPGQGMMGNGASGDMMTGETSTSPGSGLMRPGVGGGMMMGGTPMMGPTMGGGPMMSPQTSGNFSPQGMMGGMPMMGYYALGSSPISHEAAKVLVDGYVASLNNPDLVVGEFEEYSHNFYISIVERSTGTGAFELIIGRYGGGMQLEPQSMMWNLKYGMGGMMGGSFGTSASEVEATVTSEEALRIAQDFLNLAYPGTVVDEIVSYPGYYTIMTTLNGHHYGMLSVNSYTGDVWYHTWHGMFISEVE